MNRKIRFIKWMNYLFISSQQQVIIMMFPSIYLSLFLPKESCPAFVEYTLRRLDEKPLIPPWPHVHLICAELSSPTGDYPRPSRNLSDRTCLLDLLWWEQSCLLPVLPCQSEARPPPPRDPKEKESVQQMQDFFFSPSLDPQGNITSPDPRRCNDLFF